jgi:hypothetical protein
MLTNEEKLVGERPFLGVSSPSTFLIRAATHVGFTSPNYAAPSGFLNLLTRYSARTPSALFHAESVRGVSAFRGFPLHHAATAFTARYPSCRSSRRSAFGSRD